MATEGFIILAGSEAGVRPLSLSKDLLWLEAEPGDPYKNTYVHPASTIGEILSQALTWDRKPVALLPAIWSEELGTKLKQWGPDEKGKKQTTFITLGFGLANIVRSWK